MRVSWDEQNTKWWFSILDIITVHTNQNDFTKTRNYWKYLKTNMKKENSQAVSATNQLKLIAPVGKNRLMDWLDYNGIIALVKEFVSKKTNRLIEWFTNSDVFKRLTKNALTKKINNREMFIKGMGYSY